MFIHREQAFFKKITDDINMVNTWYVERLEEYKGKVEVYEKQVDRFCELRQKNEMSLLSQSQTFRQLEFGLKELYRMLGRVWRTLPEGWRTLVLSSHTEFERAFGRPADKRRKLYNGMIKCDVFFYGNV